MTHSTTAHKDRGLHTLSASAMRTGFATGDFTPLQVWMSLQEAIGSDAVNAFVVVDAVGAQAQAQAATRRWQCGQALGPLDGVPVSIKDLVMQQGLATGRGSHLASAEVAPVDAPVVQKLRAAGAVLFAKTTTTEMGCSIHGDSPAHGRTLHPRNPNRSVGGSSCGAAAQLAAGWGPLAIGSDAGGSVRIPASYTGLCAFKPSFAHIPMWPASPFVEFAHLGPMTRNVQDIQVALDCIGQADGRDTASGFVRAPCPWPSRPLRVGICMQMERSWLQPEIAAAMQTLRQQLLGMQLQNHPIEIVDINLSHVETGDAMWAVWCSRVLEAGLAWTAENLQSVGPAMQQQFFAGGALSARDLAYARQQLRIATAQLTQIFDTVDVLLTPSTPSTAPAAGDFVIDAYPHAQALRTSGNWMAATPFSHPWNLTQQPALSIPWGHDEQGWPFGLQIVGARYSDSLVLDVGAAFEAMFKEYVL